MKGTEALVGSHELQVEPESTTVSDRAVRDKNSLQGTGGSSEHLSPQREASVKLHRPDVSGHAKSASKLKSPKLSQSDIEILLSLQQRCKSVGMKVQTAQLLTVGLKLMSSMPMGKFLAVVGPLESSGFPPKPKKKRPPPHI